MKTLSVVAALCGLFGFTGAHAANPVAPPTVPAELQVPAGHVPALRVAAKGVQIYQCGAKASTPGTYEWLFLAPEADLTDAAGKPFGRHFAGPTWKAEDGSVVIGEPMAKAPSPTAGAVPWLLLKSRNLPEAGTLGGVLFIQRVDTVGGAAPADGCDEAHAGQKVNVPYTASYYFYR